MTAKGPRLGYVACSSIARSFSWALLRWMRARTRRRLLILGIAGGIAALTNASGLLIVALGLTVVLAEEIGHGRRRSALAGLTLAVTALASIWLVYIALDPAARTTASIQTPVVAPADRFRHAPARRSARSAV